jgi:PhzF family phenazine biosynthesis protein
MNRSFQLVDVFGERPFSGNPLAVVFDADDLEGEQMQQIARWINLSETTFLCSPSDPAADYRVRIFTPARELAFAGHPTLGTCHAWLAAQGKPRSAAGVGQEGGAELIQQCGAGLIRIRRTASALAFAAPPLIRSGPVDDTKVEEIAQILGIQRSQIVDAQWADNGPGWIAILLASAASVLAVEPLRHYPTQFDIGLVGPYASGSLAAYEIRAFFTDHQGSVREDPVTGSLNASVAQWLLATGRARAPYTASQGTRLGRAGRIAIDRDKTGTVWVGGNATTLFAGACTF